MVCISIIRMPLLVFVTLSAVHIAVPCNVAHCNCNCYILYTKLITHTLWCHLCVYVHIFLLLDD